MMKYTIITNPKVKKDLKEAFDFLNSRKKGLGKTFLSEYKATLKHLKINPNF